MLVSSIGNSFIDANGDMLNSTSPCANALPTSAWLTSGGRNWSINALVLIILGINSICAAWATMSTRATGRRMHGVYCRDPAWNRLLFCTRISFDFDVDRWMWIPDAL